MTENRHIALKLANELEVLPEIPDISSLLSGRLERGFYTLQPQIIRDIPAHIQRRCGGKNVPPWWERDRRQYSNALRVFYLKEAYVFLKAGIVVSPQGEVMSSTYSEAKYLYGRFSDLPHVSMSENGEERLLAPAGPQAVRRLVTMPWGGLHNYGHFVLDCLTSVAVFNDVAADGGWKHLFPPLKSWHTGHLDLLNTREVEERAEDVVVCRDVLWTNNMDHHLQRPNESIMRLRRLYALEDKGGDQKIWLSRAGDDKRRYADNDKLEARLSEIGFRIVRPETLSVSAQRDLFSSAALVVGFTGAAFANALFCSPRAKIIEIQPSLMGGIWVRNLAAFVGCEWIPYFCASSRSTPPVVIGGKPRHHIGIDIELDVEDFLNFLSNIETDAGRPDTPAASTGAPC
jgi:capsular polysaccharide biosynthesis protein